MTHNELQADLARQLRINSDRMVWQNTQLGPVGSPRPDIFTIDKSFARFSADIYEVKFSVADLRRDVTSGKWQSYLQFAHRIWFAYPKGLVEKELIPVQCGIIVRNENSWRALRKPVAQALNTLPRDAWIKLVMTPPDGPTEPQPRRRSNWDHERLVRKKFGDRIADLSGDLSAAASRLERAIAEKASLATTIETETKNELEFSRSARNRLDLAQQELARALGENEAASISDLTRAIHGFRNRVSHGDIDRAIAALAELRNKIHPTAGAG